MTTDAKPKSLVTKLSEVMKAVERVPKRGRNTFHNYDYATEADIVETVRKELAERQVMLLPSIVGETRTQVGEKGSVLTTLDIDMEFLDGETKESIHKPWKGYGSDKEDKGGYKAMTGAEKYFLLKTFLIPTGDDPEQHSAENGDHAVAAMGPDAEVPPPSRPAFVPVSPPSATPISEGQAKRLYAMAMGSGMDKAAYREWLLKHGIRDDRETPRSKIDALYRELEDMKVPF